MADLHGKVALVTGAGKGSGRAVAQALAERGAALALNDISPVNLDETVETITRAGGRVKACVADIARKMPVQGLLNEVLDAFGGIDILVNCAEVEPQKTLLEMDEWDFLRTLDVNLNGAFLLTQSLGRIMKDKSGGTIIHFGARAKATEKRGAYFASKAALQALVQSAQAEFSPFGVRVLLVDSLEACLEACDP